MKWETGLDYHRNEGYGRLKILSHFLVPALVVCNCTSPLYFSKSERG